MTEIILCIPLLLALLAVTMGVLRSLAGAWFNYRVKLELLRKLEKNPDLVNSPADVQDLYERLAPVRDISGFQDYTVTGAALCVMGAISILVGLTLRMGQLATGIYWGGMICVLLGVVLALFGLFIRLIARNVNTRSEKPHDSA